ncbi:hypothetical protein HGH93_17335 [Chitinophaga polysaccharea]|uniref:hypothetical protein n=1 Tax=Chitinophaga TaxID=79328 RepID=UPI001455B5AD|nr:MULTISPECIES: hypothetical protein [Chitinophaga]NLR59876.1 hypothetical protein [Chitinophaga polysaccharea]NLU96377.1 hypothetical protein [Chitinophaga sp. Ak27]
MAEETEDPEVPDIPERDPNQLDYDLFHFLIKIMRTIFIGLFWMLINVFLGLYLGFAEPEASTPGRMFFFYSWFVLSLAAFIYFAWRMWRKKMDAP